MTSRRDFLASTAAIAISPTPVWASTAPPPPAGRVGYILMDAETGETLDSSAASDPFIPASTAKSITALTTLATLAPTTRFLTRIHAVGPLENGVLDGDLTLVGGGDAALDTGDLAQLAKALRMKGVERVTGSFRVAGLEGPREAVLNTRQPLQAGYNPAIGPLCLNFNRVLLRWRNRGGTRLLTTHAHADSRSIPAGSVTFRESYGAALPHHHRDGTREIWTLPARDLAQDGERWFPVREPSLYAATVFRDLCTIEGIRLPEPQKTDTVPNNPPLALHQSDVVFAQIKKMMKYSNNLSAEMLGIAAAQRLGDDGPVSVETAAQATVNWLAREDILQDGLTLENHSGLSTRSRITPRQMAEILRAGRQKFGDAFPSLHTEGRLRGEHSGLPTYSFRAKTGTMHFIRCLAGFIEVDGRHAIFAIFHSDDTRRAALDARYAPYNEERPRGAKRWLRQAVTHENNILRGWISRRLT